MEWIGGLALLVGAYAIAAVPWGVVLGKHFSGIDLRSYGSRSIGTTNALRVLGWKISLAVFVLDFLKGLIPVVLARSFGLSDWMVALIGVATVAGHCWSPYIRFKGGKGVATGAGVAFGLFPWLLILIPIMATVVWLTKYVSLGSILSSILASALVLVIAILGDASWAFWIAITGIAAIIVYKHRANIERLLKGTENRLGQSASPSPSGR
jgi:glycerol-3-phosphate acyltransferase PlsY